ncbi:EAL domain-containing protein [Vibrio sp.]|nr:EAL domain-containing protein [Vibrio sp.]
MKLLRAFRIPHNWKAIYLLLIPLPIMFSWGYYQSTVAVERTLSHISQSYLGRIDNILSELRNSNLQALNYPYDCALLQSDLMFNPIFTELLIVDENHIICSSKRGKIDIDISHLTGENGFQEGSSLFDFNESRGGRSLIRIDKHADLNDVLSISYVNSHFLSNELQFHTDHRIDTILLKINQNQFPRELHSEPTPRSLTSSSTQFDYQLIITPSQNYLSDICLYYALIALPFSVILSLLLFFIKILYDRRNSLLFDLKHAIKNDDLTLVYQPLVCSKTSKMKGCEVLLRWHHPTHGHMNPEIFIGLAEKHGIINDISNYVLNKTYKEFNACSFNDGFHIGINFPPEYLTSEEAMTTLIKFHSLFKASKMNLVVEVTERQSIDSRCKQAINKLRSHGVTIAIDDFGTGQTALSLLQELDIDYIKVDKCFTSTIGIKTINSSVLDAIIDLAHELNIHLIAEGVETEPQAHYLAKKNVHYQQGYYHSKPLALRDFLNFHRENSLQFDSFSTKS